MEFFYLIAVGGAQAWDFSGLNTDLIEMLGRGYIVDNCIAFYNRRMEEQAFRIYVSDLVLGIYNRLIPSGAEPLTARYADYLEYSKPKKKEKTGDEIAAEIIAKFGLKQKENENE